MGGLFGGGASVPAVPAAPPPVPQVQQPNEVAAQNSAQAQAQSSAGAASTIQTSAQGVSKQATLGSTSLIGD